jgi:hypothetical protein
VSAATLWAWASVVVPIGLWALGVWMLTYAYKVLEYRAQRRAYTEAMRKWTWQ